MVPLQSIATGTPTIAPFVTGMTEYLGPDNALPLRTTGRVRSKDGHNPVGACFEIDEAHLVELLLHVRANWSSEYAKVRAATQSVRNRFTPDKVYAPLTYLLSALMRNPTTDQLRLALSEVL